MSAGEYLLRIASDKMKRTIPEWLTAGQRCCVSTEQAAASVRQSATIDDIPAVVRLFISPSFVNHGKMDRYDAFPSDGTRCASVPAARWAFNVGLWRCVRARWHVG